VATHLDASHRGFPPLTLKRCQPQPSRRLDHASTSRRLHHPSALRTGREPREQEAWEGKTFCRRLMARCGVDKGQRSIRRNDAPNTMGQCACSMPPASLTVAAVPYASTVKAMATPPKTLVVSARSCTPSLSQPHQSHLPAFLPLPLPFIPSSGVIGHAVSRAEPGSSGNAAIWSRWLPHPYQHLSRRLPRSHGPSERIGA
jgi:hypothetical protein